MSFGDAFLLDSFLRSGGLMACADACGHAEPDTVRALPTSCMSTGLAKRRLVGERLALVGRRGETAGADGIPVDSTGLPNSCRLPVTAVSSHNSYVSEEVRLICVVRGDTGPLLLFRHVTGSVIDADTVTRTIAEPGAMGMDTRFAVSGAHGEVIYKGS